MPKKKTNTKLPLYIAIIFFVVVGAFLFTQRNLLTQVLSPALTELTIEVNGQQVPYFIDQQLPAEADLPAATALEAPITVMDDGTLPRSIQIRLTDQSFGDFYYGATLQADNDDISFQEFANGMQISIPTSNRRQFPAQFLAAINRYDASSQQLLEETFVNFKVDVLREE